MKVLTSWLRSYLPELPVSDARLAEDLTLRGIAVEGVFDLAPRHGAGAGSLFEMDITTNRVDAMNHYGIAREAGTIYSVPLLALETELPAAWDQGGTRGESRGETLGDAGGTRTAPAPYPVRVEEDARALCGRFTARVLRGIRILPSAGVVAERFRLLEQKQISNAVDATNYVTQAIGQPTHAFDLDKVAGGIVVRRARAGERLRTLDGVERTLDSDDLVIADQERALGLAGVMGGWDSMITPATTNVLVEAAWFEQTTIRRSSKRHGLHTDASHRFERGADFNAAPVASAMVSRILLESGGYVEGELVDVIQPEAERRTARRASVSLAVSEVRRILGPTEAPGGITAGDVEAILAGLGCTLAPVGGQVVTGVVTHVKGQGVNVPVAGTLAGLLEEGQLQILRFAQDDSQSSAGCIGQRSARDHSSSGGSGIGQRSAQDDSQSSAGVAGRRSARDDAPGDGEAHRASTAPAAGEPQILRFAQDDSQSSAGGVGQRSARDDSPGDGEAHRASTASGAGEPQILRFAQDDSLLGGEKTAQCYAVTLPSWRLDLEREIDLIEEIARVYGYNRFRNTLPAFTGTVKQLPHAAAERATRQTLLACGLSEAVSSTFCSAVDAGTFASQPGAGAALENPLSEEAGMLRPSLLPGLLTMLAHNLHRDVENIALFELGTVFTPSGTGDALNDRIAERPSLSLGLTGQLGAGGPERRVDFYTLKGIVEQVAHRFAARSTYYDRFPADSGLMPAYLHPGRSARLVVDGSTIGYFGQLHPDEAHRRKLRATVYLGELRLDRLYAQGLSHPIPLELSRYQAVRRDFSFLLPEAIEYAQVEEALRGLKLAELASFAPVELLRPAQSQQIPAQHVSLLLRTTFQSGERTLREEELQGYAQQVVGAMEALGGRLRG